jgi:pyruvate/2-oxoglutarate dehydrogenase complex dihydrolipoamide acyltransferase (E2) component
MLEVTCEECGNTGPVRMNSRGETRCTYCAAIVKSAPYESGEVNPFAESLPDAGVTVGGVEDVVATDAARALAQESGLDLTTIIEGSGADGKITVADVRAQLAQLETRGKG